MENINIKLHQYQREILKKLTRQKSLRFNDLLIEGLASEHMNYHLKKLIALRFVEKINEQYALTDKGKDYTNLLDDNAEVVEKQPKSSVIINGVRRNHDTGEIEYLLNKRLEHPYYGKVGRLTGKVRFGERFEDAVKRELYEEAGLEAKNIQLENVYRKMRKREDGTFVQDVIFYRLFVTEFSGTLIEKTAIQENFWISKKELEKRSDLDVYDNLVLEEKLEPGKLEIVENVDIAQGF